jgi:uncharacterized protein (DUF433 family)
MTSLAELESRTMWQSRFSRFAGLIKTRVLLDQHGNRTRNKLNSIRTLSVVLVLSQVQESLGADSASGIMMARNHSMSRIVSNPQILGGKPCIQGTRISVEMILEWMGSGATRDDILRSYSHLSADDLDEALKYAVQSVNHEFVADAEIAS